MSQDEEQKGSSDSRWKTVTNFAALVALFTAIVLLHQYSDKLFRPREERTALPSVSAVPVVPISPVPPAAPTTLPAAESAPESPPSPAAPEAAVETPAPQTAEAPAAETPVVAVPETIPPPSPVLKQPRLTAKKRPKEYKAPLFQEFLEELDGPKAREHYLAGKVPPEVTMKETGIIQIEAAQKARQERRTAQEDFIPFEKK